MALYELSAGQTTLSTNTSMIISAAARTLLLQGHPSNAGYVLIGTSAAQTWHLSAGVSILLPVSHGNVIYGKTSAGSALVAWIVYSEVF